EHVVRQVGAVERGHAVAGLLGEAGDGGFFLRGREVLVFGDARGFAGDVLAQGVGLGRRVRRESEALGRADELPVAAVLGELVVEETLLSERGLELFVERGLGLTAGVPKDRKSTRLNSSHVKISYAVFCLKKKKKYITKYN